MALCSDGFTITVVGGSLDCDLTIPTDLDNPSYAAPQLGSGASVIVGFTYKTGAPKRTQFSHRVSKSRSGAAGAAPDLVGGTFIPAAPGQTEGGGEIQSAQFRVGVPAYDQAAATALGSGVDAYNVTLYIHESGDSIPA